jgi:HK97 family phage prohead protease
MSKEKPMTISNQSKVENRSYFAELEYRIEGDGRTITGIAVPYDIEQKVAPGLTEVFRKGAFADVVKAAFRVKLLRGHDAQALPLGRATLLRETDKGLYGEFRISNTKAGDEVLELVKDGALDQLSIGFMPLKNRKRADGVVERLKAHLAEVSLVTFGAYGDLASVTGMRDLTDVDSPRLDAAREILAKLKV